MKELFEYKIEDEEVCITKYLGRNKEVVIPEEIEGYQVTSIGVCAFAGNNLTSVDLTGVKSIGNNVFSGNNLTSIDLSGVKSIGYFAFSNNKLTSVDLLGVKSIGIFAFMNNNLTSVDLLGVKSISSFAFYNNNLASVNLSGIKSIDKYAFENNNLEAIILPDQVEPDWPKTKEFRERTEEIFGFDEEELDNRNRKYIKKYVDKMRELYMKKLYKNSRKHRLIIEYITYYTYQESYDCMLKEAIKID